MATHAPITGAPAGAPASASPLHQFENIHCSMEKIGAVIAAAGEEDGPDGMSQRGVLLVYAASELLEHASAAMSAAIAASYAERA